MGPPIFKKWVKFRHIYRKPIRTNDMSFERAHRTESNDTKISFGTHLWVEIWVPENRKTIGGSKLNFEVKNSIF